MSSDAGPDAHPRTSASLRVVSVLASSPRRDRDRDRAFVAAVLRDPDVGGAKTVVVALVDAIAGEAAGPDEFRQWADWVLPEIERLDVESCREFIRRRVDDWLLCLSVEDGHVPTPAELAEATDWVQRHLAEFSRSPAVLAVVAESARTRKTRNIAENRASSRELRAE
ncbi:hypothetical protein ABZ819_39520 [Streptomyces venezuelae]|uniref:hypothetical protein n=1 Tax=Streptomyces venezuelae TaxID=54571 RepID=UPI0034490DB4